MRLPAESEAALTALPWRGPPEERPPLPVPPERMPLRLAGRFRKRWRWVGAFGESLIVFGAIVEIGPAPMTFWGIWDRERRRLRERTRRMLPGVRLEVGMPGRASTRSTLEFAEGLAVNMLDLFPFLSEVKVNRQWAGMADMTPDFAPIMGMTPCEGFFLDAGWGTWGFKATPISGKTMAHTVATGVPHPLDHRFLARTIRASRTHGREGRRLGGPLMKDKG